MADFRMPSLGADMEVGKLVEWLVQPGVTVKRGDIIAVVETQKGAVDVEVFESGTVDEILVQPGTAVPVGTPLARIKSAGDASTAPARPMLPSEAVQPSAMHEETAHRVRVSPLARRVAADLGVDLAIITGSGPDGAIQRADVEQAAARMRAVVPAPTMAPPTPVSTPSASPQTGPSRQIDMRDAIARAMARSNSEIPHYYLESDVDMKKALAWLEEQNLKRTITQRILPAAFLLKAVGMALRETPELNGYWRDGRFEPSEAINLGVAISLRQGGLIAPAIHNVDLLSVDEVMAALRDLVLRSRNGGLRSSELSDASITVTNLGDLGVKSVYGVIYPPQVALVGFGRISDRPWAIDGMLSVRPILTVTLAADHRASDGNRGGKFLTTFSNLVQEPETL